MARAKKSNEREIPAADEKNMRRLRIDAKCGSCLYLDRRHKTMKSPCRKQGQMSDSDACPLYEPDYSSTIRRMDPEKVMKMCQLVNGSSREVRHSIAFALTNSIRLEAAARRHRDAPMRIGDPVAVSLTARRVPDCVAVWASGRVIGISNNGRNIYIYAAVRLRRFFTAKELREMSLPDEHSVQYSLPIDSPFLKSKDEWKAHRRILVETGKMQPNGKDLRALRQLFHKGMAPSAGSMANLASAKATLPRVEDGKIEKQEIRPRGTRRRQRSTTNQRTSTPSNLKRTRSKTGTATVIKW